MNRSGLLRPELLVRLGESLVHVQGEFQGGEGAGGFDEVVGVADQAGQDVVDHRRVGWAGCRQVDGLLALGGVLGQGGRALAGESGAQGVFEDGSGEGGRDLPPDPTVKRRSNDQRPGHYMGGQPVYLGLLVGVAGFEPAAAGVHRWRWRS